MKSIHRKTLRSFQLIDVPFFDMESKQLVKRETYREISGKLLIPAGKSKEFIGCSRSKLQEMFADRTLTPYTCNGREKTDDSNQPVFFDLYGFLRLNLNTNNKREKVTFQINGREFTV